MIVLNTDKELIRVTSWADIESRPGFTVDLNPNEHKLHAIIGRYAFSDRIRCGLSTCHTPHGKGYIVTTKDGRETNIGKDCGKTYFGVDFETLSRKFDQEVTDKENRDKLWSFIFRIEEFKNRIAQLCSEPRGANWIHRVMRPLIEFGRSVPTPIVRRLQTMVRTRQPILTIDREATEEEIQRLEVERGKSLSHPQYIEEPIAQIEGLEALYPENDLKTLLVLQLEEEAKTLEQLRVDDLSSTELNRWSRWLGSIDPTLERAISSVQFGQQLLRKDNLAPLARLLSDKEHRTQFEQYLKEIVAEPQ